MKKKRYTRQTDSFMLFLGILALALLWVGLILLSPK
jgi:predicted nucleic acid-binding Zn ribbon protein